VSHYSWTKESRTLDKKLNGKKKTSEIKKKVLYGKEMSSDSQKLKKKKKKKKKKKLFTRRMILDLFQKFKDLLFISIS